MRLLALIPALDAEDTVGRVVTGALRHVGRVLVVDDGSADGTADAARAAGAEVISLGRNMGKGAALMRGFRHALENGYDGVVTLDADAQHDPDDIPRLAAAAEDGADMVIGSRQWDREAMPSARYHANMVGVRAISWRAKAELTDSQSGFRLYTAKVLGDAGARCTGSRFELETEILIRAGRGGYRIKTVPVKTVYSEEVLKKSHFRAVADTYRICMMFLRSFVRP